MLKAIFAAVVTSVVGLFSCAIFSKWNNAEELGVVLAVAIMGAFIIYFNNKRK